MYSNSDKLDDIYAWPHPNTLYWNLVHCTTIGGGNVDSLVNKSRYKSKMELFLEKIGITPRSTNEACLWGLFIEEFSQLYLQSKYGRFLVVPGTLFQFPLSYTADGILLPANETQDPILIEIKTPYYRKIMQDGDEPLPGYKMQVLQGLYMMRNFLNKAIFFEALYLPICPNKDMLVVCNSAIPAARRYDQLKNRPIMLGMSTITFDDEFGDLQRMIYECTCGTLNLSNCNSTPLFNILEILFTRDYNMKRHSITYMIPDDMPMQQIVNIIYMWDINNCNSVRFVCGLFETYTKEIYPDHNSVESYY
ncbi:MAG: hypothetical protein KDH96_09585, partial [Candidatus Riesia sp.]|nr:hypothetical protein [Candidatus Riesia sp.]